MDEKKFRPRSVGAHIDCSKSEEIEQMKKDISELKGMREDVTDIRHALLGDDYNPGRGLVKKVDTMDGRISIIEKFQYKILVWTVVIIGVFTIIFKVADFILKYKKV